VPEAAELLAQLVRVADLAELLANDERRDTDQLAVRRL
jgi:hypothetical protein